MLLERDGELAAIDAALAAACAGRGALLVLEGPAGIGKTALLDEARRRASGLGMRVLLARGGPLERDLAHGVARQLLEAPVRSGGEALLAGAAELARPVVRPEDGAQADAGQDRRAPVVHGLYWLTANLAQEGPLLLAVDDAQWADPASLRYLAYLGLRLDGLPAAVVATVRTGESADRILDELTAVPSASVHGIEPLSARAVEQLVRASLPGQHEPKLAPACRDATGGVPFLVEALLDELAKAAAPPAAGAVPKVTSRTVGHATLLRLSRLAPEAVPVARYAAVLGRHANVARIARLAGLDEDAVLRSCDALSAAHILRPGLPPGFVHPIVAASVYGELPPGERSRAHARAAEFLAAEGEPDEVVAPHLLATAPGTTADTVARLRAAAAQALARGAPESAVAYLRRCDDEPPPASERGVVLHELGRAEAMLRDEQAAGHLRAALDLTDVPARRAQIALDLVETRMFAGHWQDALDDVGRALAELGDADPEAAARLEVFRAGMTANDPRLVDRFESDRPRLDALAARDGRGARLMAALLSSCAVCRAEPAQRVDALIERGLDGTRLMASPDADAWGPQVAASLAYLGELDRAMAAADAMRAGARERGSVYGFVRATGLRALVEGMRGDLRAVEADLRSAFELSRANQLMFSAPPLLRWSVDALLERPEVADIADAVEQIDLGPELAASFSGAWLLEARGRLRFARGDVAAACADLAACGDTMGRLHVTNPVVTGWRSALALALPVEEREAARRLAAEELAVAEQTELSRSVGIARRTLGLLADEPVDPLREAIAVLVDAGAPLELARTQLALGAALRRVGQRTAADAPLRAALDLAHHCGAERLAVRAEDELRAIGARPRRRAVAGVDALTPSEARVAAQAAAGMTNREIAQALFVTAKTVENQLSRVYQKLGIRGREALAESLGGGPLMRGAGPSPTLRA